MIIIGIDPGTATTGYGIIKTDRDKKKLKCLGFGTIQTDPALASAERLKKINNDLSRLIKQYKPEALVFESLYFFKNFKTAIRVSQAGGVILLTAAKNQLPVYEFTPLQVKLAISGFGMAKKDIVQKRIKTILSLKEVPKPDDAADALAIALTYVFYKKPLTS